VNQLSQQLQKAKEEKPVLERLRADI
jgi:structural maintenance of chromosome 4